MFLSAAPASSVAVLQTEYAKTGTKNLQAARWWALGGSIVAGTGAGAGLGGGKGAAIGGVVGLMTGFALGKMLQSQTESLVAYQTGALLKG